MFFETLKESLEYAQANNMDVKKSGSDLWEAVAKSVIPLKKRIVDLERALADMNDKELRAEIEAELQKLKDGDSAENYEEVEKSDD